MIDWKPVQARLGVQVDGAAGPRTWSRLLSCVGAMIEGPMHLALGQAFTVHAAGADLTTTLRIAHALAQSSVETQGFTRLIENLNYSAERIMKVWPARFASLSLAAPLAHNPEALANKVYGGRFGNVNVGDGWKYRGRGTKQTTFHDNYAEVERVTGIGVVAEPDKLADPDMGTLAGCIYWRERGCNQLADLDDIEAVTRRVNGGLNGLAERRIALKRAKVILIG